MGTEIKMLGLMECASILYVLANVGKLVDKEILDSTAQYLIINYVWTVVTILVM